jgi:hypothetical protein
MEVPYNRKGGGPCVAGNASKKHVRRPMFFTSLRGRPITRRTVHYIVAEAGKGRISSDGMLHSLSAMEPGHCLLTVDLRL